MASQGLKQVLACDVRSVRVEDRTALVSFPRHGMEDLGILDDEGLTDEDLLARVTITADGKATVEFQLED